MTQWIRSFSEIGLADVGIVGGKNASLGEMVRQLGDKVRVPNGFATTADAYFKFLEHNDLRARIETRLDALDPSDIRQLENAGAEIRGWIVHGSLPADMEEEIAAAYARLEKQYGDDTDVAVRSSATAEDLPTASFAGQQDTFLNIRGLKNLLATFPRIFASLFNDRAISYRTSRGFDHLSVALSIGVQKMVRSDLASSGVMFTLDTETGFRDAVTINAAYGLGENVVKGAVNPDEFVVFKPTLREGKRPIIKRQLGDKSMKLICARDSAAGFSTRNVTVPEDDRRLFSIDDGDILELARAALEIENHYSRQAGQPMPMDIEWAKDGHSGKIFIVQARPETVRSREAGNEYQIFRLQTRGPVIARGKSVGNRVAAGNARVIHRIADMHLVQPGDVLVTDMTDPDWEPAMKVASAVVTNRGGRTCHAAIIAREIGIPAVVGCGDATQNIANDVAITVSCAEGDEGLVYEGRQDFVAETIHLAESKRPKTRIMMNVANPDQAFGLSFLPNDGVGLARLEFIIGRSIRVHPRALLEPERLDEGERRQVDQLTAGYGGREQYFVSRLSEGIGMIAAAFYPKEVIVRCSDFKSNEYAQLLGGSHFEPREENPMIGLRGAARYYDSAFQDSFALECRALKRVREEMGLRNVSIMIPFVRSVVEARRVIEIMRLHGLERGQEELRFYLMCEIPSNALLATEFLKEFDGFSIGSNDLTQLTLGVDRDSGLLTGFDERDPAVLKLMELAIRDAKKLGKYVGICGQAPSDFPEITEWLVKQGISSLSLNPDSVIPMTQVVIDSEARR